MAALSGASAQGAKSPAPSPDAGVGYSLPLSVAVVASSLVLSLMGHGSHQELILRFIPGFLFRILSFHI
ncbi:hypothetical protein ACS0TY_034516 [Phlomoides rotata]